MPESLEQCPTSPVRAPRPLSPPAFGFRHSSFGFPSDFATRISGFPPGHRPIVIPRLPGPDGFTVPGILKVSPISDQGNLLEIATKFGGPDQLRNAVNQLQLLLYAS